MCARFVFLFLAIASVLAAARPAGAGPSGQYAPPPVIAPPPVVAAPYISIDDDPAACQKAIYNASMNCIAFLADGDVAVYMKWGAFCGADNCVQHVSRFVIYRVPPDYNPAAVALAHSAPSGPVAAAPAGPKGGAPGSAVAMPAPAPPISHAIVAVSPDVPPNHVVAANGAWIGGTSYGGWGTYGTMIAALVKPKLGDCYVARVVAANGQQSNDSNKVCVDSSVKFGLETVTFGPIGTSHGLWNVPDIAPSYCKTNLGAFFRDYAHMNVGRTPFSQTDNSTRCTGTQVWQTVVGFDLGNTKLPVWKAELTGDGDASCVAQLQLVDVGWAGGGGTYQSQLDLTTYEQQPVSGSTLDADVMGMLNYKSSSNSTVRGFSLTPTSGSCMSAFTNFSLRVTRLR